MTDSRKIGFPLEKDELGYPPAENEWLWASGSGDDGWVIDNIPWYTRDVSLHDTVAAMVDAEGELWFAGSVVRGGHSTVRVLPRERGPELVAESRRMLDELGCTSEQFSSELPMLAVDIPGDVDIAAVIAFLDEGEARGAWGWETGYLADRHRDDWPA